jgi:hypothetical protein
MKALSIRQPYAWMIMNEIKDVENRSWWPPKDMIGKRFLVHAGLKKLTQVEFAHYKKIADEYKIKSFPKSIEDFEYGAIIGSVVLEEAIDNSDSIWADKGAVHYVLSSPKKLKPKKVKGQLKFFDPMF